MLVFFSFSLPLSFWIGGGAGACVGVRRFLVHVFSAACLIASVFGLALADARNHPGETFRKWVPHANGRTFQSLALLLDLPGHRATLEEARMEAARVHALPRIREAVGDRSIDLLGHAQGVLLLNGLNWKPRPVFQGYTAYTPHLVGINAEHFRGPGAPAFVLLSPNVIDQRLPTSDDGLVLLEVLKSYRPVLVERGYALFARGPQTARAAPVAGRAHRLRAKCNERFSLPMMEGGVTVIQARIRHTFLGSLRGMLFRDALVQIDLFFEDGTQRRYRLIPGQIRSGIPVSPLPGDVAGIVGLACGDPTPRVQAAAIVVRPRDAWAFESDVPITVRTVPIPVHAR
ncbi:MAG: hypothetical protein HY608_07165 [Planctomycetes bacterium]|nr:hypothetical protein [Planctomycetota bacterium]